MPQSEQRSVVLFECDCLDETRSDTSLGQRRFRALELKRNLSLEVGKATSSVRNIHHASHERAAVPTSSVSSVHLSK